MSDSLTLPKRDRATLPPSRPPLARRVLARLDGPGMGAAKHLPVLIALAVIAFVGWQGSDVFLTDTNLLNLLQRVSAIGIIAAGTAVLMIAGEIDLSIGAAVSVISIFVAKLVSDGTSAGLVILAAMGLGLAISFVFGVVVTFTRAPAFMVTLGGLSILSGIAFAVSDGQAIVMLGFDTIGTGKVAGIPISVLILVAASALLGLLLYRTSLGRSIFAVGGNAEAARLVGIPVAAVRIASFCLNGALVGLGAAVLASNVGSGGPAMGVGLELQVIAAVVMGGATLGGGQGSLVGAFLGVLLLGSITNVLNLLGAESYVGTIVFGAFIVLAVALRGERATAVGAKASQLLRSLGQADA